MPVFSFCRFLGVLVVFALEFLSRLLWSVRVVGFCGSRRGCPELPLLSVLALCVHLRVLVGDGRGVDAAVRSRLSGAEVFSVVGSGRSAFAARSIRFVRALAAGSGVLVSFPGQPCPVGLLPSPLSSQCFCGLGSGSWASVAFACGLRLPVVVWVACPSWVPAWGFRSLGCGFWVFGA